MKLDIQMFSGGSYDYTYEKLDIYFHNVYDEELDLMLQDLKKVLHDLEWWDSGDYKEEKYRETLNSFKIKWFGNRDARLKEIVETECKKMEQHLLNVIGSDK